MRRALGMVVVLLGGCGEDSLGRAREPPIVLEVSPRLLDFGEVTVSDERVLSVEVSNISGIRLDLALRFEPPVGDYALVAAPPTSLAAGASFSADLAYRPIDPGSDTARLIVEALGHEDADVDLLGTGVAPAIELVGGARCGQDRRSLNLGAVRLGETAEATIALRLSAGGPIALTSLSLLPGSSGEFSFESDAQSLSAGQDLEITVRYRPVDPGPDLGVLAVRTALPDYSLIPVSLCAEAVAPDLCSAGVSFPPVTLGGRRTETLTLTSCGNEPVVIGRVALETNAAEVGFSLDPAPAAPITLDPGQTLDVPIAFEPPAPGQALTGLAVESNIGRTLRFPITAVGVPGCDLIALPAALSFPSSVVGVPLTRLLTLSNVGAQPCEITAAEVTVGQASFTLPTPPALPHTVVPGQTLQLPVRHTPTTPDVEQGRLAVTVVDPPGALEVPLEGDPSQQAACVLSATPTRLDFGAALAGAELRRDLSLTAVGELDCALDAVRLRGGVPFSVVAAPTLIPAGESRPVTLSFRSPLSGSFQDHLDVDYTDPGGPSRVTVPLSGVTDDADLPVESYCLRPGSRPHIGGELLWSWTGDPSDYPAMDRVASPMVVAQLTDDDGDGRHTPADVPDIVFVAHPSPSEYSYDLGLLRAVSGDTGANLWSAPAIGVLEASTGLAAADLDRDGRTEVIVAGAGFVLALDARGQLLWRTAREEASFGLVAPALADFDGDGVSEIVVGREVFDHRGNLRWRGAGSRGVQSFRLFGSGGAASLAADIDGDGRAEVVAGDTAYADDGSILWRARTGQGAFLGDGGTAVGPMGPSGELRVVLQTEDDLYALDAHTGAVLWQVADIMPDSDPYVLSSGQPLVADFDGDGSADVAITNSEGIRAFDGPTGDLLFRVALSDPSCCEGATAFDFDADGDYELVVHDAYDVRVIDGCNGRVLFQAPRPSFTALETPVIADVNADGHADLLVGLAFAVNGYMHPVREYGLRVYTSTSWPAAPRSYTQYAQFPELLDPSGYVAPPRAPSLFRATAPE